MEKVRDLYLEKVVETAEGELLKKLRPALKVALRMAFMEGMELRKRQKGEEVMEASVA